MLGVKAAMHLIGSVQGTRKLPAGAQDALALANLQLRPLRQQAVEVAPVIQGTGHEDRPTLAFDLALAVIHRLQSGNPELLVAADIAKLASEGRLAERPVQGTGQVIALALEVVAFAFKLQAIDAAPAATTGIGLIHRIELQGPELVETVEAMALKQCHIGTGKKVSHSRPSKNVTTWRMRRLSDSFRRSRPRYCR
ncbi:hypothetical protein D3C79_688160 [compost metagenome]